MINNYNPIIKASTGTAQACHYQHCHVNTYSTGMPLSALSCQHVQHRPATISTVMSTRTAQACRYQHCHVIRYSTGLPLSALSCHQVQQRPTTISTVMSTRTAQACHYQHCHVNTYSTGLPLSALLCHQLCDISQFTHAHTLYRPVYYHKVYHTYTSVAQENYASGFLYSGKSSLRLVFNLT